MFSVGRIVILLIFLKKVNKMEIGDWFKEEFMDEMERKWGTK